MSKFKVYRIVEERTKHQDPVFYIQRYRRFLGWFTETWEDYSESGSSTYRLDFNTKDRAKKYIEINFMKPEIIHHESFHITK